MTSRWSIFSNNSLSILFLTIYVLLCAMTLENTLAEPFQIGKIPAHRTVKVVAAVKVNENTSRSTSSISNGFTLTTSASGTTVLSPLLQSIFFPPLPPTVLNLPDGGTTRGSMPNFSGSADPNTTIEILDGERTLGTTTTDATGMWSFTPPQALSYGPHVFTIRSTDARSQSTNSTFRVTVDCSLGLFGSSCESVCPGGAGSAACGGRGSCSDGLAGTGTCACDSGYFDLACNGSSLVCQVDTSNALTIDSEWIPIATLLGSKKRTLGNSYFLSRNAWTREEQESFRFLANPKAWFGIADSKSCLGYRNGAQVLNLFLRSDFPFATYYDSREGKSHRLGSGPRPLVTAPDLRVVDVVWKLMASPEGKIYYIVQRVQLNKGDSAEKAIFLPVALYQESSGELFERKSFSNQTFDPNSDTFITELGAGATVRTSSLQDDGVPAIEAGVDLLKLSTATGLTTSKPVLLQVNTQAVETDETGRISVKEIDRTDTTRLENLSTQLSLDEPSITVKQSDNGRAMLNCEAQSGARPKGYLFRLTANSTNRSVYYESKARSRRVNVVAGSSYRAACSYFIKAGKRSSISAERMFRAKQD